MIIDKKIFFFISFVFSCWFFFPAHNACALDAADAYKAIVKVNTYYEDENSALTLYQTGSGVIIAPYGLVLTNDHVVTVKDYFGNDVPVAFQICLTNSASEKPDCGYSADLIAKDGNKDLALLKIRNITSSISSFENLQRAQTRTFKNNDPVTALGYPIAGGETITITSGSISGTEESYYQKFIKTDSVISVGSSGGALIDANGVLLGITTSVMYNLGYAIDITGVNEWIDNNSGIPFLSSSLQNRMNAMIIRQNELKTAAVFANATPNFSLNKPSDWDFGYYAENSISTADYDNPETGVITMEWIAYDTYMEPMLDITAMQIDLSNICVYQTDTIFAGRKAKKFLCPYTEGDMYMLIFSSKNYMYSLVYYYGKNNIFKDQVDASLKTMAVTDNNNNFVPGHIYTNFIPYFSLSLPDDWTVKGQNSPENPAFGQTLSYPEIGFAIHVEEQSEGVQSLGNEDYFDYMEYDDYVRQIIEYTYDLKAQRYFLDPHFKINTELNDEIAYFYKGIDENDGDQVKMIVAGLRIRDGEYAILVPFHYFGSDTAKFEQLFYDFINRGLKNFTFGRSVSQSPFVSELQIVDKILTGTLIKGDTSSAVYLLKDDAKRYVFPNEAVYFSYYTDFSQVQIVPEQELALYPLGGNITFSPGTLIKIPSIPKVYVVTEENYILWVETEDAAGRFFGSDWSSQVFDVPEAFFIDYLEGASIK